MKTLLCLLLALVGYASAALMAIDLGSEFLKVSLVRPGRIPVSIVINEISKRKTAALVAIVDGERLIGEEANAISARYPDKVIGRARDFLGRRYDDPELQAIMKDRFTYYTVVPDGDRPTVAFKMDDGKVYSAEEMVASILYYAKEITAAIDHKTVTDTVLLVPAFYGHAQRQALLDAASLAGLNVLGIMNTHSGAALQFGIERNFDNATQRVVMYDLGANSLEVSLVEYSSYQGKEFGKTKSIGQFVVKDVAFDHSLGAEAFESVLADHFANEFNTRVLKDKGDVRAAARSMAKLRKQCKKTKEVLSANIESHFSVEELYQDHDFRSAIGREHFERLLEERLGLTDRARRPLDQILARNNLTVKDIDYFELLGGGSRIPIVQRALQDSLGGLKSLDRHLDADEASVMGGGLIAANMSTQFRLRQFGMSDGMPYSIQLVRGDVPTANATVTVLSRMKRLPQSRKVTLTVAAGADGKGPADTLDFSLAYDESVGLPPAAPDATIGTFHLSGLADVYKRYNTTGKVALHLRFFNGGMVEVEKAESTVEVVEMVEVEEKVPLDPAELEAAKKAAAEAEAAQAAADAAAKEKEAAETEGNSESGVADEEDQSAEAPEGAAKSDADPAAAPAANATSADSNKTVVPEPVTPAFKLVKVTKPKKNTYKIGLKVGGSGYTIPPMTPDRFNAARANLERLREAEKVKRETARAKNDLESFIIASLESLQDDEGFLGASTDKERQGLIKQLTDAEEWLYGDGEHAKATEYSAKLAKLRGPIDRISIRVRETKDRPKVLSVAKEVLAKVKAGVVGWAKDKPWIGKSESDKVNKEVGAFESWLDKQEKAQAKKKPQDDPVLLASDILDKLKAVEAAFKKADGIRKPKEEKKKEEKEEKAKEEGKEDSKGDKAEKEAGAGAEKAGESAEAEGAEGAGASKEDTGDKESETPKDEL